MSRLRLGKKLQPAKKAWRNFSNTLQSKDHKLNIPKAIKTTLKRILSTLRSLCHLITSRGHRSLATRRAYAASNYHLHGVNFSAISIEDLFAESPSTYVHANNNKTYAQGKTGRGKEVIGNMDMTGESSGINTIEDAWKVVVAKSPQLHVDERADEFISKFHEDMKLQKERSLLEFQEMLARSA